MPTIDIPSAGWLLDSREIWLEPARLIPTQAKVNWLKWLVNSADYWKFAGINQHQPMKLAPMPCCYVTLLGMADAAYGLQSGQEADKMTTAGRTHVFDLWCQPNHYFLIYAETGSAGASTGALPV